MISRALEWYGTTKLTYEIVKQPTDEQKSVTLGGQIQEFHDRIFNQIDLIQQRWDEAIKNRRVMHAEVRSSTGVIQTDQLYRSLDLAAMYW